ncbi:TPA: hypothetical protein DEP58_02555 [Patescibacteria group bacterium]|nr:MAG: hypothetical protein UU98_C0030G0003 [Parcubacteria group bacterium GW2011_GWD2_42_14]HCC05164.1 hypothetical protein [Patescibacteria group bacterium]
MKTNYQIKKLDDVCEIIMGQSPASSTYNEKGEGLPFYQGKKDYGKKYPTPRVWCSLPIKIVEDADILISVRAPVGALNISKEKSCIGRGLAGLRAKEGLDQKYLWYFLKLRKKNIADLGTGSTFTAISKKHLENLEIPLPSLAEQKKIVARIEKVFAKIDEATHLRVEAQKAIAKLLPATLHEIFEEGRGGRWNEISLGDVVNKFQYGSSKKSLNSGKIPCLRMGNLQNGEIDWTNLKYAPVNEEIEKFLLKDGDVLFNRTNSPDLVGKTSIFRGTSKAVFAGYLIRIDYDKEKIIGSFLNYVLNSVYAKEFCRNIKTDGVSQSNINAQKLATFTLLLPPLSEQKKIVARLDTLSAKVRILQEAQSVQLADLKALKQSILHEAFNPSE